MSAPVRPHAVVFTLADLPEGDRAQLHEVAGHLRLPADPGSDRIALVLLPGAAQVQIPGLLGDGDVARGGPSLLLLAMRLLLADLYSWPEARYVLGSANAQAADAEAGYALYAADPDRFTVEELMAALAPHCAEVRKGLLPRGPRPPAAPGDRVPVLGWQVPVLGSREPVARLRDLRPAEQRPHRFCGQDLPLGVVPGGESGRHRLYLRVLSTAQRGERGHAEVEFLLGDSASGRLRTGRIGVVVRDLAHLGQLPDGPVDPEDDEGLAEVLREVLPVCLQPMPGGDLVLCDLFGLGLSLGQEVPVGADGGGAALEVVPRVTASGVEVRALPGPCARGGEEEWAELLDPALWGLSTLCALLAPEDVRVSEGGRYVALRLSGRRDGQPVDGVLVLEMDLHRGARAVAWPMDLDGPAPGLALAGGWLALAGGRGGAPVGLSCLGATGVELAGGVLLCQLPDVRISARLPLPPPMTMATMAQAGPPQLYALPGGDAILCQQPGAQLFCVIDGVSSGAPAVRPARPEDLRALLLGEGGGPLRQLLHGLSGPGPVEDVPALGFLGMGGELQRRLRREAAGLLARPVEEAADAVLRLWLQVEGPRTCVGEQVSGLA